MTDLATPIIDRFGRVHDYLRISLTDRCNLRCLYCMPEEGVELRDKKEFMTAEETVAIAKEFVSLGIKKIRLTGGEPLIKKNFAYILHELSKLPVELALTTNAILIDKYYIDIWDAGIRTINVSLDSLNEERFNFMSRRNYFDRVMSNIQLLISKGFNVKINVVVIKGINDSEINDFINWTLIEPVNIRFIEFMPFDGNGWNWDQKVSEKELMDVITDEFGQEKIMKLEDGANATSRSYKIEKGQGSFGFISSMTNPFCDSCNRIRLTADGKIKNCLFSNSESDLLSALRNGQELESIIRSSILKKEFERGGTKDFSTIKNNDLDNRAMVAIGG